jgi:hypothetical protein
VLSKRTTETTVLLAVLLVCMSSATAKTTLDLEKKYGKPIIAYLVSEHILMTPEYSTDDQVCMMRLHPRHYGPNVNYVSANLPFKELTRVLNELVPVRTRGAKKEPFDTGAAGGGAEWMTYAYENVEFSFVSSFRPDPDSWKTRKEFVFTIEPGSAPAQPQPIPSTPSDNDFSSSQGSIIELVNIKWKGRQCGKQ